MNLSTKTIAKNTINSDNSFDEMFKYFFKGYHQYITTVMTQLDAEYFNKMLDEMQAEFDAEESKVDAPVQAE